MRFRVVRRVWVGRVNTKLQEAVEIEEEEVIWVDVVFNKEWRSRQKNVGRLIIGVGSAPKRTVFVHGVEALGKLRKNVRVRSMVRLGVPI